MTPDEARNRAAAAFEDALDPRVVWFMQEDGSVEAITPDHLGIAATYQRLAEWHERHGTP
jgi:hypothetical protein